MMTKHLAIFTKTYADLIIKGHKTIESRFSKAKLVPFGVIHSGDLVYMKLSGEDMVGQFKVNKVISFDGLTPEDIEVIKREYGQEIAADESFWQGKKDAKYGTLIFIGELNQFITSPIRFSKSDRRGWVVLG